MLSSIGTSIVVDAYTAPSALYANARHMVSEQLKGIPLPSSPSCTIRSSTGRRVENILRLDRDCLPQVDFRSDSPTRIRVDNLLPLILDLHFLPITSAPTTSTTPTAKTSNISAASSVDCFASLTKNPSTAQQTHQCTKA
jgi:hypothetical protein